MTTQEKEELGRMMAELIRTHAAGKAVVMDTTYCYQNIVTQI